MTESHVYPTFPQKLVDGFTYTAVTLKCCLLLDTYTPLATHQYYSNVSAQEVTGSGYTAGGVTLTSKTSQYSSSTQQLVLSAENPYWTTTTISPRFAVFYVSTGTPSTSYLISYMDFGAAQAVSAQPYTVTLNSGIFRLQGV